MRGHVILKTTMALGVLITAVVGSCKLRDLSDLGIRGFVPLENLASDKDKREGVLDDMQVHDVVHGKMEYVANMCAWCLGPSLLITGRCVKLSSEPSQIFLLQ